MPDFMQVTQNVFISWILSLTHLYGEERVREFGMSPCLE